MDKDIEIEALKRAIERKNALIARQAKQLDNVRGLVELGKATLNKIIEAAV